MSADKHFDPTLDEVFGERGQEFPEGLREMLYVFFGKAYELGHKDGKTSIKNATYEEGIANGVGMGISKGMDMMKPDAVEKRRSLEELFNAFGK